MITRLIEICARMNDLSYTHAEDITSTIKNKLDGTFNQLTVYKLNQVTYQYVNNDDANDNTAPEPLIIAFSAPKNIQEKSKKITQALQAREAVIEAGVPPQLNLTYLYRDQAGRYASQFSPVGDLTAVAGMKAGNRSMNEVRMMLGQIFLGVSNYHERNLAHRDLKPNNIIAYTIKGNVVLKIADHGEVIKVNDNGTAVIPDVFLNGSRSYRSPELTVLMTENKTRTHNKEKRIPLAAHNWKASDCYAVGMIVRYAITYMLVTKQRRLIIDTRHSPHLLKEPKEGTEAAHLANLYFGLVLPDVVNRTTIHDAMQCPFFGKTTEARDALFQRIRATTNYSLVIDEQYLFNWKNLQFGNPFYLLNPEVKKIFQSAESIIGLIKIFEVSLSAFNANMQMIFTIDATQVQANRGFSVFALIINQYKIVLKSIDDFMLTTEDIAQANEHANFIAVVVEFKKALEETLQRFAAFFEINCRNVLVMVLDQSIKELIFAHGLNAKRNMFNENQSIRIKEGTALQARVNHSQSNEDALGVIYDYLGDEQLIRKDQFRSILVKNLGLTSYKPLPDFNCALVEKKRRLTVRLG